MNRRALLVSAVAIAAASGIGASYVLNNKQVTQTLSVGGPFKLIGTDGQEVTEAAVKGKYSLFFFGFTFCPDACP
ncbi:SCO family protein, partial [Dongia sp.]|uniref:SCO family protein n=1 Tax=Dongia sp. TaxID=1977262 RepID=UPI0034A19662